MKAWRAEIVTVCYVCVCVCVCVCCTDCVESADVDTSQSYHPPTHTKELFT